MKHDNPPNDQSLPSWGPTSLPPDVVTNTSDADTEPEVASPVTTSIQSHSGLRRIKSTLSVLAPDTPLIEMPEGTHTSDSKSNYSVADPSSSRIRRTSSHTSIASFIEQWTLSSKNCSIRQAKVAT